MICKTLTHETSVQLQCGSTELFLHHGFQCEESHWARSDTKTATTN